MLSPSSSTSALQLIWTDFCVAAAKELGVVRVDLYSVEEGFEEIRIWVCLRSINDGDERASTVDR